MIDGGQKRSGQLETLMGKDTESSRMAVPFTDIIPMLVVGLLIVHGVWKVVEWVRARWPDRDGSG